MGTNKALPLFLCKVSVAWHNHLILYGIPTDTPCRWGVGGVMWHFLTFP